LQETWLSETERLMALKGYSQAFERTLSSISEADGGVHVSEALVLDLFVELWGPSVDAGIMTTADLRGWRQAPVYIRGSEYVPPAPGKVPQLMRVWADTVNTLDMDPVSRAAVAHWAFVHVHPFMDGNGRAGRALWLRCLLDSPDKLMIGRYGLLRTMYYLNLTRNDPASEAQWRKQGWDFS
jgi:hypothetical protein